jgi:hypothetical protein
LLLSISQHSDAFALLRVGFERRHEGCRQVVAMPSLITGSDRGHLISAVVWCGRHRWVGDSGRAKCARESCSRRTSKATSSCERCRYDLGRSNLPAAQGPLPRSVPRGQGSPAERSTRAGIDDPRYAELPDRSPRRSTYDFDLTRSQDPHNRDRRYSL